MPLLYAHGDVSIGARYLKLFFGLHLYLHTLFVNTGCDGSGETMRMHRLM